MRSSRHRLTNGHRAAVCGLQIAGLSLTQACQIVGIPYKQMRDHLGGWHKKKHAKRRWKGELLDEVREAWCDRTQKVATIAERFQTTPRQLTLLANREDWPKRKRGPARGKHSVLSMDADKRRRFWKLARVLGRSAAITAMGAER
jgi:hypothetical protein